jgi:glycerol uptake facilitator-like aquaporin
LSEGERYGIGSRLITEFTGSMFLVMAAISPIILFNSPELMGADISIAVIADAIAVGFILFALIEMFGPVGGAHFNPAVTYSMMLLKRINIKEGILYMIVQFLGGFAGMISSHLMFYHEIDILVEVSSVTRNGGTYLAEVFGTFLLVTAILYLLRTGSKRLPLVIGLLVGGMLMATSSTMFANPQVSIARIFTYSAAGVSPFDAMIFVIMEIIGATLAVAFYKVTIGKGSGDRI